MSTMDDDSSLFASRSSKGKKLSKSRGGSPSGSDRGSPRQSGSISRPHSRASSRGTDLDYSDVEDDNDTFQAKSKDMGTSDLQLAMQLELARQNSLIQHGLRMAPLQMDFPIKSTIYEGLHLNSNFDHRCNLSSILF